MKKVLIVVPGCGTGGILTSLIALLNSTFVDRYRVNIFIMNGYGKSLDSTIAKYDIGCNYWISKVHSYLFKTRGLEKFVLLFYKILFRIPKLGKNIVENIESVTIRKIEKLDYDCIISFQESISLQFVSKFSNPNKVAWIHCDYSRIFTNESDEMAVFSRYSKIVTVSNYTRKTLCQLLPQLTGRVFTIYNIMDRDAVLTKAEKEIDDNRFATDNFTIISVGRISEVKQFHLIPKIASKLKSDGYTFRWYIIGGGNEPGAAYKLHQAILDFKLDEYVICLGNKVNPYPYFRIANLLVSTSYSEACPMIFNEAKILDLPVVSNNFGSAYEFIKDGKDGIICSIDQMAEVIENVYNNNYSFEPTISESFNNDIIQNQIDNVINNYIYV